VDEVRENAMRVLVIGAAGNVGRSLMQAFADQDTVIGADLNRGPDIEAIDITDYHAMTRLVDRTHPDLVALTAAWTDVDGCARDPRRAVEINGVGAQNVAIASARYGADILTLSTNEVFDGLSTAPYTEYDVPSPRNAYGYSKWFGERAVQTITPRHIIVRTAWLVAHGGQNFVQAILRAASEGRPLRVVIDEVANPTYNEDLVTALVRLIEVRRYGIYHLTNAGATSRYDLARHILDHAGFAATEISPIMAAEWPRSSLPPAYAILDNYTAANIGVALRPWQDAMIAFLQREGLLAHQS
jgi:dTDP-4-dehydrorhamnose reductase